MAGEVGTLGLEGQHGDEVPGFDFFFGFVLFWLVHIPQTWNKMTSCLETPQSMNKKNLNQSLLPLFV